MQSSISLLVMFGHGGAAMQSALIGMVNVLVLQLLLSVTSMVMGVAEPGGILKKPEVLIPCEAPLKKSS